MMIMMIVMMINEDIMSGGLGLTLVNYLVTN